MEKQNFLLNVAEINNNPTIEKMALLFSKSTNYENCIEIIENIEPFNDIFYKNCFYNSLFPIVNHFGKSILPILVNDIIYIDCNKEKTNLKFDVGYKSKELVENILSKAGIGLKSYITPDHEIVDKIVASLKAKNPVIIWVDCYYIPNRSETYLSKHWAHTLLVYGVNKREKTFNIIEHSHKQNLTYSHQIISFKDLINSYKGYQDNFNTDKRTQTYYEFYLLRENSNEVALIPELVYAHNILNNRALIKNGIENLKLFIEYYREVVSDELLLSSHISHIVDFLNEIVTAKKAEIFKLTMLLKYPTSILEQQEEILDGWDYIRLKIAKYMYSLNFKKEVFIPLLNNLSELIREEEAYYKNLCNTTSDIVKKLNK